MRGITRTAAVLVTVTAAATGCSSSGEVDARTTTGPEPATAVLASSSPAPPAPTLSDTGVDGLAIGLSEKEAARTGLLGDRLPDEGTGCLQYRGKAGVDLVYVRAGKVQIIAVGPQIGLSTGIGVGSTLADVRRAYPDLEDSGVEELARVYAPARRSKVKAEYRIGLDGGKGSSKVTEIALQAKAQTCYE